MYARQLGHVSLPSLLPSIYYINFLFLSLSISSHTFSNHFDASPPFLHSKSFHSPLFSFLFPYLLKGITKDPFPLIPSSFPPKKPIFLQLVSHKDFFQIKNPSFTSLFSSALLLFRVFRNTKVPTLVFLHLV